jgi:hypothetical protein
MSFSGAFIIPVAYYKGEKYFYFGVEKNGEVSAFGGKRDKETIQECAVREFKEESLGVFAKAKIIEEKLKHQAKHGVKKIDKFPSVTYFVPMEKLKYKNPIKEFATKRANPKLKRSQREMSEVIAVKASEVTRQINLNARVMTFLGHNTRPLLRSVLQMGKSQGIF